MQSYYVKVRPTNGGEWNNKKSYEFWTTVFDMLTGNSYLSIQDVPAGIEVTNTDYWTLYSVNDARYEYLQRLLENVKETTATSEQVTALKTQLTALIAASGATEGNTELQDIRNGNNNKIYATAGEAVREQLSAKADKDDAMSWSQWFDLHRKGWRGGVLFSRFGSSQSTLGKKTGDNADVVIETSTNITKGRNDFADSENTNLMFNGIDVNGYIDEDGEPHITAVEGSPEFDRYGRNGDVYRAFLTPFYRRVYTDTQEGWEFSDTPQSDMKPWVGAVRPDGTYRSFYLMAKYIGVYDDKKIISSISGRIPVRKTISHNSQITEFKKKGTQYCGFTSSDMAWVQWMFDMKFANKNSQATMSGATSYYLQYAASIVENDVRRIIVTKSQANNLLVGSYVSIGYGYISNGALSLDRWGDNLHKYADSVKILKIEAYDNNNSAVYVDAKEAFSTEPVAISDTITSPVYISTMHWYSGSCDNVLGADGSPSNPKTGKEPFLISGVEHGYGGYIVLSDIIMNGIYNADTDVYKQIPYIVNDSRKIATSITADYVQLAYEIPDTNNAWKYISEAGFDERYPFVGLPVGLAATSSTGYCDGVHTGTRTSSLREVLWFGSLGHGSFAGARCASLYFGLTASWWNFLPRLSSLRRGAAA